MDDDHVESKQCNEIDHGAMMEQALPGFWRHCFDYFSAPSLVLQVLAVRPTFASSKYTIKTTEMQLLRRCTLILSVAIALSVLVLVSQTFWRAAQSNPPALGPSVQDLQILVVILLSLSGLYMVVFLLSPSMSSLILKQQADQTVNLVRNQMSLALNELRELKDEMGKIVQKTEAALRELRQEARNPGGAPTPNASTNHVNVRELAHVSGRLRVVDNELVQIYQALASPGTLYDPASAGFYLNRAIGLCTDPSAAADLHYALGCLLAREGEPGEALLEVQTAFRNKSPDLEQKLAKDTEEGGPLFELANQPPYDRVVNELLLDVSVGA